MGNMKRRHFTRSKLLYVRQARGATLCWAGPGRTGPHHVTPPHHNRLSSGRPRANYAADGAKLIPFRDRRIHPVISYIMRTIMYRTVHADIRSVALHLVLYTYWRDTYRLSLFPFSFLTRDL